MTADERVEKDAEMATVKSTNKPVSKIHNREITNYKLQVQSTYIVISTSDTEGIEQRHLN